MRRRPSPRAAFAAAVAIALTALAAGTSTAAPAAASAPLKTPGATVRACPAARPGTFACAGLRVTGAVARPATVGAAATPAGFGPADLRTLYALPANGGAGSTVAVIDAQDDPNAETDLAAYRTQFGLAACTSASGCFRKVSQTGSTTALPAADAGWAEEESLDLDAASAVAPAAHLILVEANSASMVNLGTAVNEAVALGATSVDLPFGASESSTDLSYDSTYFNHPGVALSSPGGDIGFGVAYPAASQYVTAVGGTGVTAAPGTKRGYTEYALGGGGGCSGYEPKPTWQTDSFCTTRRTLVDVAAYADPTIGFAVYDTYGGDPGWEVFAGNSVASGIITGVFADGGAPTAGTRPASFPYAHPTALHDITVGPAGCSTPCSGVGPGYDTDTGLGTPNGVTAFKG